jgi:NTP pyrophosphatase (non-canonical NTP hydrolase)
MKTLCSGPFVVKLLGLPHPIQEGYEDLKSNNAPDTQTTIDTLREEVREFVSERDWERYHSPKNLAASIAIEAAEIMEHFQWYETGESRELVKDEGTRTMVAEEVADVIIYCLALANQLDIDVSTAVREKLENGRRRFPIGYMPTKDEESQ